MLSKSELLQNQTMEVLNDGRLLKAIAFLDKHLLEYSHVVARLRSLAYEQRTEIAQLQSKVNDLEETVKRIRRL